MQIWLKEWRDIKIFNLLDFAMPWQKGRNLKDNEMYLDLEDQWSQLLLEIIIIFTIMYTTGWRQIKSW